MKSRISLVIALGLIVPLFAAVPVFAVDGQDDSSSTTQQDTTTETKKETLTEQQKKELSERIQKRKSEAKAKLNYTQEKRLKSRCKNAQGLVRSVGSRVKGVETSRGKVHTNLVDRLKSLETKLKSKGVDTTTLQSQITELEAKIATFNADLAVYKQAVSDLGNIEGCTADPAAFKASLEAARSALTKVREDAVAIRSYVKDTIKPTLKEIRAQLEASQPKDESSEGTEANN